MNLPEAHRFLTLLVCDWCGHKILFDATARATMRDHLAGHPQSRYATRETADQSPAPRTAEKEARQ